MTAADQILVEEIAQKVHIALTWSDEFLAGYVLGQAKWTVRDIEDKAVADRAAELCAAAYTARRGEQDWSDE